VCVCMCVCVCAEVVFNVSRSHKCWLVCVLFGPCGLSPNNLALLDEFDFSEVLTRAQMPRRFPSTRLDFTCLVSDEPIGGGER